jgi:predicted Rossmann fold flavoprotein
MAAITAARQGAAVVLLEKNSEIARKVLASGGGRCNLTNTLEVDQFIKGFGRNGRFMIPAMQAMDSNKLRQFFETIGVATQALDGFRVFPVGHRADTVKNALLKELEKNKIKVLNGSRAQKLLFDERGIRGVATQKAEIQGERVVIATGSKSYSALGGSEDGYRLAAQAGHKIVPLFPAMVPLICREAWVASCRADTIGKAEIRVNLPEARKLGATGDLIFTNDGIRGPVVLDFAREITPLLEKYGEVPLLLNLTGGLNEEQIREKIKKRTGQFPEESVVETLSVLMPRPLAKEICLQSSANPDSRYRQLEGCIREKLVKMLAATPLTVVGHGGFEQAMVTRGGVSLKEVDPHTLASKLIKGLFFCGEVLDLDGPCGGFNLQWAFSSGYLAAISALK